MCPNPPFSNTGGLKFAGQLLAFACDSVYWYGNVEEGELLQFRKELAEGKRPQLAEVQTRGVLGYEWELRPEVGLRVEIAPESNLRMGLYIMTGPRWLRGISPDEWESRLRSLLVSWGFSSVGLRLSRVDPSADFLCREGFPKLDVSMICSRAKKRNLYYDGNVPTGLSAGNGSVRFRLYDKLAEVKEEWKYWMHEVWKLTDGIESGETVARAEWQLKRDFLKEFGGIECMADLLERWGDVMRYLLDWFRLAGPEEGHEHKRLDLPVWAWLREELGELGLGVLGVTRGVWKKLPPLDQLRALAVGVMASITCGLGLVEGRSGPVDVVQAVDWLRQGLQGPEWRVKLGDRWKVMNLAAMA